MFDSDNYRILDKCVERFRSLILETLYINDCPNPINARAEVDNISNNNPKVVRIFDTDSLLTVYITFETV